jgi:hypothetical protein
VHSDFRRIKPAAARPAAPPRGESTTESAEFREAIAYMNGVADAIALVASAPPEAQVSTPSSRRITLPYAGPQPSTFEDGVVEPGSGVRLKAALPCPELYDLAGVDRTGTG